MAIRRFLCMLWLAVGWATPGFASEPVSDPLLRIETGMHTTLIRRIIFDPAHNRVLTCSDDKTVRVWQMPDGRLVNTLRVPIDAGHEGKLFGLAVSPDGNTVAVAGWTGWDWDRRGSIYLLDVGSGRMLRRIGGIDNAFGALNWTPDGKFLVAGLQANLGLRVIRVEDGAVVAEDRQYKDKILDLDIAGNGQVAAISLDGWVRLYDREFRLIGRRKIEGGEHLSSIRFSPDSQLLAVSFVDTPRVSVASAAQLEYLYSPDLDGVTDFSGFAAVAWSSDGEYLYAGGDYRGSGLNPLFRWPGKGRGPRETRPLVHNRINELRSLSHGEVLYATEDPEFGVITPAFEARPIRKPSILDFSDAHGRLEVSADGSRVRYPVTGQAITHQQFDVLGAGDQDLVAGDALEPPVLRHEHFRIENWHGQLHPRVNGVLVRMDDHELARSYAIVPDGAALLLGGEWSLRNIDPAGAQRWQIALPAVAWAVNVSGNGQLAVTTLSDGSIRWYRVADGDEVLAYFPHRNGSDWIAWIPDGYYASSLFGDNYIGWHLNRGKDLAPDFYRAVQFERVLFRPDVVQSAFRLAMKPRTRSLVDTPLDASFRIGQLREIAPPRIHVEVTDLSVSNPQRPQVQLRVEAERNALPMEHYTVFINKIPVTPASDRSLQGSEREKFVRDLVLDLPARANDVRVEAFNGKAMGVREHYVELPANVAPEPVPGDLYLLAIGINEFDSLPASMHLQYAARDAEEVVRAFAAEEGRTFRRVHVKLLNDGSAVPPGRQAILDVLAFARDAGPHDTVVIFLASHGISDQAGNYFFVPKDVAIRDISRAMRGEPAGSMVSWEAFSEALRQTSGYRMLIVDTCHAQDIEGRFDAHSLMKRSAASLFPMMVAARGSEQSQEYAEERHGLFTYALLNALREQPDPDRDGRVTLRELFGRIAPEVARLHVPEAGSQTPQLVAAPPLDAMPVLRHAGPAQ